MADVNWDFNDTDIHIFVWMSVGLLLYAINVCFLLAIFGANRKRLSDCNVFLSLILLISIFLNMVTTIFMTANNGNIPNGFASFQFDDDNHCTTNERIYFILYILSFNTFNIYCLICICIEIIQSLDIIKSVKYVSITKYLGILIIIIDIIIRIICIILYCTPNIYNKTAIFISLYSILLLMYFIFVLMIFMIRRSSKGAIVCNLNEHFLYKSILPHLVAIHTVFIIWFIATILYLVFVIFISSLSVISLWIQLIISVIINFVVSYKLIPLSDRSGFQTYPKSPHPAKWRNKSWSQSINSSSGHPYAYCNMSRSVTSSGQQNNKNNNDNIYAAKETTPLNK